MTIRTVSEMSINISRISLFVLLSSSSSSSPQTHSLYTCPLVYLNWFLWSLLCVYPWCVWLSFFLLSTVYPILIPSHQSRSWGHRMWFQKSVPLSCGWLHQMRLPCVIIKYDVMITVDVTCYFATETLSRDVMRGVWIHTSKAHQTSVSF